MAQDRHRLETVVAEALHRQRAKTLRQRLSIGANEQRVVAERGWLGAKRAENRDLHACIGHVVFAADDVRNLEINIVDDARERVEERAVGADQNRI